ncbi:ABC transporter ATP-binding protein [Roseovarius pacificus]|uniref:ABC transporter ATP-binding protein n=1 Tax=Roseovarius pacificus TaxID=337701 RepID=UPI002A18C782|nr:ABC transporter ATP-binding protein [Roseovarius pacificus]
MANSLKIKSVAKSFGALNVLQDVTFDVEQGEIVGLLGPNGSGKSTLLSVISGFLPEDSGSVSFAGREMLGVPAHKVAQQGLIRTFQLPSMPHRMTPRELIAAGARSGRGLRNLLGRAALHGPEVDAVIARFALEPVADIPASSLSGGQKKLLSIAVALQGNPRLLCLDEPTAGVHPNLRARMVQILQEVASSGVTILIVEHDMHFVRGICDRCVVLDGGHIIADCAPDQLTENERVVEAYLGKAKVGIAA